MIGENQQLVTNEPIEFEKEPVEVQDCRKITDHFGGIYRIYPNLVTGGCEHVTGWTCKHKDLNHWCPKISPITGLTENESMDKS